MLCCAVMNGSLFDFLIFLKMHNTEKKKELTAEQQQALNAIMATFSNPREARSTIRHLLGVLNQAVLSIEENPIDGTTTIGMMHLLNWCGQLNELAEC